MRVKDGLVIRPTGTQQPILPEDQNASGNDGVQPLPSGRGSDAGPDTPGRLEAGAVDGERRGIDPGGLENNPMGELGKPASEAHAGPVEPTFNAQPTTLGTKTNAVAGPGYSAKDLPSVKNAPSAEQPKQNTVSSESTVEQTGKAPEIVAGDAATTDKLPAAGAGAAVQADGVKAGDFVKLSAGDDQRPKSSCV